jgi:hypothetical protein
MMEYYTEQEVVYKVPNRLSAASSFVIVLQLLDSHEGYELLIRGLVRNAALVICAFFRSAPMVSAGILRSMVAQCNKAFLATSYGRVVSQLICAMKTSL